MTVSIGLSKIENRVEECADLSVSDLKQIILQSKLDSQPKPENTATVHHVIRYAGKLYKVRAYENEQSARRQKLLLDKVPDMFAKCYGQIDRYLVMEFVEGTASDDSRQKLTGLGYFIADLATVKAFDSTEHDFDSWCRDLQIAKIFTPRTISLLRRYYVEARKMPFRWQLGYFDAMPTNFVFTTNSLISIDEKHLRFGPEGISLIKPQSKLPAEDFLRVLDAYYFKTNFDRFNDPKYREFLLFYYFVYGLAVVGTHKKHKVNIGIKDFHLRRRTLLQIVRASRLLCLREESLWLIQHRIHRIWKFMNRMIAYLERRHSRTRSIHANLL
jgi:hypothetical protein